MRNRLSYLCYLFLQLRSASSGVCWHFSDGHRAAVLRQQDFCDVRSHLLHAKLSRIHTLQHLALLEFAGTS
jgi:hypothetical protein